MSANSQHGHGHTADPDGHGPTPGRGGPLRRAWGAARHLVTPHSHDTADRIDSAMEASRAGMRALWVSLAVLGATAAFQAVVVVASGSVALLSDTLHNVADALTAVPVGIAFLLGRRPATRRFTYGYGRAEDVAGILVVLVILGSAVLAGYESLRRLAEPTDVRYLWAVAVAGLVGAIGNEVAAQLRLRTGRRIGSAALVADGLHARTDAFTSLAVLVSAGGVALGWRWADPVVGLAITAAIATVTWGAARQVLARLMDAVDPGIVEQATSALRGVDGVVEVDRVRLRWVGHDLHAEVDLSVPAGVTIEDAHRTAHAAEHELTHAVARLTAATVHAHPTPPPSRVPHVEGRVFLLRHGETEWSVSGKHTGRTDVPLTERGRGLATAAGELGRRLRGDVAPALVLTSPRRRARDSAELAGLRVDHVDERLAEWDYGECEGRTTPEIRETVPDWTVWTHPCPGGETAEQVGLRADAVLADACAALPRGDVVLVGHGHFSRVLLARWIELPAASGVRFAMEAPSWAVLGHDRGVPRLDHVNVQPLT